MNNPMQMIRHDYEFVQADVLVMIGDVPPLIFRDFANRGKMHGGIRNIPEIKPPILCANGYEIVSRSRIIPVRPAYALDTVFFSEQCHKTDSVALCRRSIQKDS